MVCYQHHIKKHFWGHSRSMEWTNDSANFLGTLRSFRLGRTQRTGNSTFTVRPVIQTNDRMFVLPCVNMLQTPCNKSSLQLIMTASYHPLTSVSPHIYIYRAVYPVNTRSSDSSCRHRVHLVKRGGT